MLQKTSVRDGYGAVLDSTYSTDLVHPILDARVKVPTVRREKGGEYDVRGLMNKLLTYNVTYVQGPKD